MEDIVRRVGKRNDCHVHDTCHKPTITLVCIIITVTDYVQ